MTILEYIRKKIIKYGRLKSYLVAVSLISAIAASGIALWFVMTFFDLIGAFKDFHNTAVDLMRCCAYVFRALSLLMLFLFFVRDYGKRVTAKFEFALLFLLVENIFTFAYYVFNSIWNSVEYISRSDITTGITLRVVVFVLFLLSLYGLYRQSKTDFSASFKKAFLLFLFIISIGVSVWLDQSRIYGSMNISAIIFAEIAGFIVYSPYIIYISFPKKPAAAGKQKKSAKRGKYAEKTPPRSGGRTAARPKSAHARREPVMKRSSGGELDDFEKKLAELDRAYKKGEISRIKYERRKSSLMDEL